MRENRLRNALGIGGVDRQASYVEAKLASAAAHVEFVVSNKSTGRIGDELSPKLLPMCSATFLNCQRLPRINGTLGHPLFNSSAAGERRIWPSELRRRCSP